MPQQPSREQFEAAAKRVMQSAPAGLSRDQFFDLVDKELAGGWQPQGVPRMETGQEAREPDTWWGGFIKGLKNEINMPALMDMATITPQDTRMGNAQKILPFLIPSGIAGAGSAASNIKAQLGEIGRDASALRGSGVGRVKAYGQSILNRATDPLTTGERVLQREPFRWTEMENDIPTGGVEPTRSLPPRGSGSENISDLPLWKQQEMMETHGSADIPLAEGRGGPPGVETSNMNELPLWKQQELMEASGSAATDAATVRSQTPPYQPPPAPKGPVGTVVGKAPTLDDVLNDILQESMATGDEATAVSLPAEFEPVGEGATRQSGKFKKSESVGQPGGYSSGRPAVTPERYDELDPLASGARERVTNGGLDLTPGQYKDLLSRRGMETMPDEMMAEPIGAGPAVGPTVEGAGPIEDVLNSIEYDPGAMAGRAQELRRQKGSRDAAREMFGSATPENKSAITTMSPGPSQLPLEAEERMRTFWDKPGEDKLMALLMGGLGGHTVASLWDQ